MIYFAQLPTGAVKIGYTSGDAETRMAQLQIEFGVPFVLLGSVSGERSDEAEWHSRFAHLRISPCHREQFHPDPELMWAIGRPDLASEHEVDGVERKNRAIHLPAALYQRLRIAAAVKQVKLSRYLAETLGPIAERDIREGMALELSKLKRKGL